MATIFDIAKFITDSKGEMSAMKLQKLMYYAQAWSMVWEEEPLFDDEFEAWANGPILPDLYNRLGGNFKINSDFFPEGNPDNLTEIQKENIGKVLEFYGEKTSQWLTTLVHQEDPWLKARGDIPICTPSSKVISKGAMHEYYSSIQV